MLFKLQKQKALHNLFLKEVRVKSTKPIPRSLITSRKLTSNYFEQPVSSKKPEQANTEVRIDVFVSINCTAQWTMTEETVTFKSSI